MMNSVVFQVNLFPKIEKDIRLKYTLLVRNPLDIQRKTRFPIHDTLFLIHRVVGNDLEAKLGIFVKER